MSDHVRLANSSAFVGSEFGPKSEIIAEARRMQSEAIGHLIGRLVRPVGRVFASFVRHLREAQAMRELASLNDRTLADLGLRREEIPAFVMQGRIVRAEDERVTAAPTPTPEPPKADALAVDKQDRKAA